VDADLRRPMIAAYTGLPGAAGLTSVLVGRASAEDVVQTWGSTGLFVLASGPIPPNPSELLSSRVMADLVDRLTREYDVVVFDTAPMGAVADAAILARMLDGALVVVDRTRAHRPQLSQTMDSLEKSGVRVLGIVLNRATPSKDRHAYYRRPAEPAKPWWRRMFSRREQPVPIVLPPARSPRKARDAGPATDEVQPPAASAPSPAPAPAPDDATAAVPDDSTEIDIEALELDFPEAEDSPLDDELEDELGDPILDDEELYEPARASAARSDTVAERPKRPRL
jgi:succinoglycan biosynthesis transport protein ExoP